MLAQGPALFMMCYINSGEFERLLNVHSQRDEQRLLFKDGLLKASGLSRWIWVTAKLPLQPELVLRSRNQDLCFAASDPFDVGRINSGFECGGLARVAAPHAPLDCLTQAPPLNHLYSTR